MLKNLRSTFKGSKFIILRDGALRVTCSSHSAAAIIEHLQIHYPDWYQFHSSVVRGKLLLFFKESKVENQQFKLYTILRESLIKFVRTYEN